MRPRRATALALLLGAFALGQVSPAPAQQNLLGGVVEGSGQASPDARLEQLRERIASLAARAQEWSAKSAEYEAAREEAPARLREIEREIASLRGAPLPEVPRATPPAELEVMRIGAEQDAALARQELLGLEAEHDRRAERRRQLPDLLAEAKARLTAQRSQAAPVAETPELQEAQAEAAARFAEALANEVRAYEQEMLSYQARGELLEQRIALARLRAQHAEARREALGDALTAHREGEAERAAQRALESLERTATLTPEVREAVRQLAAENVELARRRTGEDGLLHAIEDTTQKLQNAERRLKEIEADFTRLSEKIASSGLTDSVGLLLRKTKSQIPDVGMYRRFIRMRQDRIAEVETRLEEVRDELEELSDLDALVAAATDRVLAESPGSDRARLEALLRDLLETKRRHLEALLGDYETYFQRLVDFDARQQELADEAATLLRYIDGRVLWIPSGGALRPRIVHDGIEGLQWLLTPRYWGQLGRALIAVVVDAPLSNLLAVALLTGGFALARRSGSRLDALGERARQPASTEIRDTVEALALSLLRAPWGPVALGWVGWRLGVSPDATQFVRCIAHGLVGTALVWLSLEIPRRMLRPGGLAEAHFGWPREAVRALHRELGWLAAAALPLVFLIQTFEMRAEDDWRESIGRVALIAILLGVAVFTHRVAREGGALQVILREAQQLRLERWKWRALHVAALAPPIALALAAGRGYSWTALQLSASYHLTLVYLFLLLVLLHFSMRWSLVARRKLAFEKLEKARAAQAGGAEREPSDERAVVAEPEIDLATVDAQTGRLLSTTTALAMVIGLWFLWADLVPAVGLLDGIELWSTTETQTVELRSADGTTTLQSQERVVPITVASVLLALLIAFATLVLVRNLPGLLEISLFRRLGTAAGERYAYSTIAKYAIVLLGAVLAFNAVGVGWSNIQWLVAAVGLGLGFGLQEIFANFVSGLIILFERPIRVGDTVTIGDVSGTVSKIRIRATWITGFDRKELVVPNKEFVTNQLVNWSLTDPILRVEVPVGIAYGSDTELAMRELLAVAKANRHVLSEPKPQVFFLGFGDSALNFELRCFSPDLDHRLLIQHELHVAVDRAFRQAGIEIAFPQRDLHLKSVPEGFGPPKAAAGE